LLFKIIEESRELCLLGAEELMCIQDIDYYSISRIALELSKSNCLFPRDALHAACCKAHKITNIATNDSDI